MSTEVSGAQLREIMRNVPSAVTVITTTNGTDVCGMTAGSFTSICLDPPLVSFNVTRTSGMYGVIEDADECAVHILGEDQMELARWFARPNVDGAKQMAEVAHRLAARGLPIIDGTVGVLRIRLVGEHRAGDSSVFIGRVIETEHQRERGPMLYYRSSYHEIGPPVEDSDYPSVLAASESSATDSPETPAPNSAKS